MYEKMKSIFVAIPMVLMFCSDAPEIVEEPTGRIVLSEYFTYAR